MASLTIRNLDDPLKRRLRIQAAHNGRSMEEEVRQILRNVLEAGFLPEAAPPAAALPMRISPPPMTSSPASPGPAHMEASGAAQLAIGSVRAEDIDQDFDRPQAPAQSDVAAVKADETKVGAPATAPELPAMPSPSLSVEAFTDGLRQRLALLVGVEAAGSRRD